MKTILMLGNILFMLLEVMFWLLVVRAILTWIVNPNNSYPGSALYKINSIVILITEPLVAPCRRLLSRVNTGMMDFSILASMLAVIALKQLLFIVLTFIR